MLAVCACGSGSSTPEPSIGTNLILMPWAQLLTFLAGWTSSFSCSVSFMRASMACHADVTVWWRLAVKATGLGGFAGASLQNICHDFAERHATPNQWRFSKSKAWAMEGFLSFCNFFNSKITKLLKTINLLSFCKCWQMHSTSQTQMCVVLPLARTSQQPWWCHPCHFLNSFILHCKMVRHFLPSCSSISLAQA